MPIRFIAAVAFVSSSLAVAAAELPRDGTDEYTTTYITTTFNTMKLGDRSITNYDSSGVTRNDKGGPMFNNMGTRCLGQREATGTEPALNRGMCIDVDAEGDQVFSTYEAKGLKGVHIFVGGTGKYTGITGTADYTYNPLKGPDGKTMNIVPHVATWKLPKTQ